MAKKVYEEKNIRDIADAIREKNGLIDTYTTAEMADAIRSIPNGGGGANADGIPEGYARCDFIQFSGNQYVDIGLTANQDSRFNVLFTWENSTQRHLFGCASSDNKASITSYMNGSWRFGDKYASKSISTKNPMLPYSALLDNTTIGITNSVTAISGVAAFETVGTILIGGARDADGSLPGVGVTGKIFCFFMWQSGVQVRKLIPVVSDDGVYRFFDLISKTFFDSVTSTPLGGGNL